MQVTQRTSSWIMLHIWIRHELHIHDFKDTMQVTQRTNAWVWVQMDMNTSRTPYTPLERHNASHATDECMSVCVNGIYTYEYVTNSIHTILKTQCKSRNGQMHACMCKWISIYISIYSHLSHIRSRLVELMFPPKICLGVHKISALISSDAHPNHADIDTDLDVQSSRHMRTAILYMQRAAFSRKWCLSPKRYSLCISLCMGVVTNAWVYPCDINLQIHPHTHTQRYTQIALNAWVYQCEFHLQIHLVRKKPLPPGEFLWWVVSKSRNQKKRFPPEEEPPKLINFGGCFSGEFLSPRVFVLKKIKKKPPPGGGGSFSST